MEQLAITDPLTGLYNRRHFFFLATTEMERAARYNKDLSVIMIDLDHFKLVNDTYGHKTGDQVLQSIAQSANQALRRIDVMGRYGGEEFAILLPETNMEKGMIVAERLRALIDHTAIPTGQGEIKITACFGLAGLETCPPDIDILLDCADKALYAAKQAGRNQVRVFRGGYKPSF
jgi:diguanylate cyclase (GGDEF)-like protein